MTNYLPLGSIVLLDNGEKMLLIYGRAQKQTGQTIVYDYLGCLFPEGNISSEFTYLFNHNDIKEVVFTGYSDEADKEFIKMIQENLQQLNDES